MIWLSNFVSIVLSTSFVHNFFLSRQNLINLLKVIYQEYLRTLWQYNKQTPSINLISTFYNSENG